MYTILYKIEYDIENSEFRVHYGKIFPQIFDFDSGTMIVSGVTVDIKVYHHLNCADIKNNARVGNKAYAPVVFLLIIVLLDIIEAFSL